MKCILLGAGGREAIMATRLAKRFTLYSIMPYVNPSISKAVSESGGTYIIGSPFDKKLVRDFINRENVEICVVNNDNLLEAGLVDVAKEMGLYVFGPTRAGAKIEWSKGHSLKIIEKVAPEVAVKSYIVENIEELEKVCNDFEGNAFVVKPNGLTAGKGVKVGGEHFLTREEGICIASEYLRKDGTVVIQEKINGYEFTIMGFTDGEKIVVAPATYDYPYRYEHDRGSGTGGMGCFSCSDGKLPFLEESDVEICKSVMQKAINEINKNGCEFNGVLNGGFFKTDTGDVKFMEFNARLGDPEALNVLSVMETPFEDVVFKIAVENKIDENSCVFKKVNSYVVYVVSKNYAVQSNSENFSYVFDENKCQNNNVKIYYGSTERESEDMYHTIGNSRLIAFVAVGENMEMIKNETDEEIERMVRDDKLDFRKDIANIAIYNQ